MRKSEQLSAIQMILRLSATLFEFGKLRSTEYLDHPLIEKVYRTYLLSTWLCHQHSLLLSHAWYQHHLLRCPICCLSMWSLLVTLASETGIQCLQLEVLLQSWPIQPKRTHIDLRYDCSLFRWCICDRHFRRAAIAHLL